MIRVLDPATAVVRPGAAAPLPTLYVAEDLMVRGPATFAEVDERARKVVSELGWVLEPAQKPRPEKPDDRLRSRPPLLLRLRVGDDRPAPPPDAWVALQQIASVVPEDVARGFELNHVLLPSGGGYYSGIGGGYYSGIGGGYYSGIGGGYYSGIGGGYYSGIGGGLGPAEYGVPGLGGKAPVAVVMDDPAKAARPLTRRPVVVMPDTGIGQHPWFPRSGAVPSGHPSLVTVAGTPVADDGGGIGEPLTGAAAHLAGHGTFIAGIIRQLCPEARLEAHALMSADGLMQEDELLDLLHALAARQLDAITTGDAEQVIDVISLSAGYYHESSGDTPTDTSIADVLADLADLGVLVVAGAGNDATDRPFLPAALAARSDVKGLPLVSVGALNPNQATVSLFSNAGDWVRTYRSGAAIVSTLPTSGNAGAQASAAARNATPDRHPRATIDLDDFSGGFGVWSGTSFATPVVAGELARALAGEPLEDVSHDAMVQRGFAALDAVVGRQP